MGERKWEDLPIQGPAYKLHDEREQDKVSVQVMDCYVNEAGHTIKRPGIGPFITNLSNTYGVDGLYWWDEVEKVIAVSGANVYSINNASGTATLLGSGLPLPIGNRVSFALGNLGDHVLAASGENIVYINELAAFTTVDADAPTAVRSLASYDQYIIAQQEGTDTFAFDEVGSGGVDWRTQDVLTAESKPDRLLSVLGTLDGFVCFGKQSCEFWVNDGVTPFSRVRGLTFNRGTGARYSPALLGDTWLWLDNRRVVMRGTLNKLEEVSDPINKELPALTTVEDGLGDIMTVNGWPLYVLTFPSANKTFVYYLKQNQWLEWGNWHAASGIYRRFRPTAYCYAEKWNMHLVGDYYGKVYELSSDYFADGPGTGNDDEPIRSLRRTGFITHGTGNRKRCHKIRLRLKRGAANDDVPTPVMQVRWREQGRAWSPTYSTSVSLGEVGQHEIYVTLNQCGSYRARQYEFIHSDATEWILMSGEELVEVMAS